MSNNSQSNIGNVKICIQAIWSMNFTILSSNLRVYIEKIKVRKRIHVHGPIWKILKHQPEVDNNLCWLVYDSFLYNNLLRNQLGCSFFLNRLYISFNVLYQTYECFITGWLLKKIPNRNRIFITVWDWKNYFCTMNCRHII